MRIRNEMIWNRTVNLYGGAGKNIAMDLANEFLNRDFKGKTLMSVFLPLIMRIFTCIVFIYFGGKQYFLKKTWH